MIGTPTDCPLMAEIVELVHGRYDDDRLADLESHIDQCSSCQRLVEMMPADRKLVRLLRESTSNPEDIGDNDLLPVGIIERLELLASKSSHSATEHIGTMSTVSDADADEFGQIAHYRLLELIGSGGMGRVYRAEDRRLLRPVAIKLMRSQLARRPSARQRFLREARAMAALRHDHVITVFEVGEAPGVEAGRTIPYLAMELLDGESLADWMKRHPLPPAAWVARIGRQAAAGLAAAHARGLIHRDVKPANLWLEAPSGWSDTVDAPSLAAVGRVKLLDFGLANPVSPTAHAASRPVGTPAYMAPEQMRGEPLDPRADLYALGVVLYELTTGRLPPISGSRELLIPVRQLAPNTSPAIAALIEQLLSVDPADRPESSQEVERAFAALCPPDWDSPAWRRRRRWFATGLIAAAVTVTVGHFLPDRTLSSFMNLISMTDQAPSNSDNVWANELQQYPPEHQYTQVMTRLRELNPSFQASATRVVFRNDEVVELALPTDEITNIQPLRALTRLQSLILRGSRPGSGRLTDLSPLHGMPLETLDVSDNPGLSDMTVIESMPKLSILNGEPVHRHVP